ncbi:peptide-methionine (S)-S-oxide reductase MsrA [Methylobacterium marchantiae]|uniref:Peptide methionine sulfoxide reductase MsrA n=1 Tax=Methylobacterium marchantiae TaxID=600331 RepID=A0ABW3X0G3_9HYPH|nr:Peptide methionine sulfoxide reductase MsrA [Methylobacterium marchantiae]
MLKRSSASFRAFWPIALLATAGLGMLAALAGFGGRAFAEEPGRRLPDAAVTLKEKSGLRTAVFAGGCFWGVQGVFQHVRGVTEALSGYAGGSRDTASYQAVGSGRTGHAEAVRITYDPSLIRYDELLTIFFSVALDPTQVNRQGPDSGTQYRSAIFVSDAEQARVARAYVAQLNVAQAYAKPIATKVECGAFYPAEAYHQDFMARNPRHSYIVANDAPKLRDLQRYFPERTNAEPILVGAQPPA